MFKQEIADALKAFEKYIVCVDKTPEDCEGSLRSLMEKTDGPVAQAAIRAYAEAAWTTGHFVRVPAGLDIPHPIEVITVPSVSR